jgi:hypothetical protein
VVDAASFVEAEDAVATGQQDQEGAGFLSPEEEHPLGPAGDAYIVNDRRAGGFLATSNAEH